MQRPILFLLLNSLLVLGHVDDEVDAAAEDDENVRQLGQQFDDFVVFHLNNSTAWNKLAWTYGMG